MADEKINDQVQQLDLEELAEVSGGKQIADGSWKDIELGDTKKMFCPTCEPRCDRRSEFRCTRINGDYYYFTCTECEWATYLYDAKNKMVLQSMSF